MATISVVISTFSRSQSLDRTLQSVKPFADEIIVVDNTSTDDTQKVAREYTKNVFTRENNVMLNSNKNFGISKATCDWVLYLDDDEVVDRIVLREIKQKISGQSSVAGYWFPRKNIIFGKWIVHGIWWPDYQLRLFKKGEGKYPQKHVHEYITVSGKTEKLINPIVHYNYDSLSSYLHKMQNLYIPSEVEKIEASGYVLVWTDAVRFPLSDFLKLYFAQAGWKDGLHGLVLATLQAFYSFLVFVTLWEREKFREIPVSLPQIQKESARLKKETDYWILTAVIQNSQHIVVRITSKIWRKLFTT